MPHGNRWVSAILAFISVSVFISSAHAAFEEGLSTGNELSWIRLQGRLNVNCFDPSRGSGFQVWHCVRDALDPSEYARFVTVPGGSASSVNLKCLREDGTSQRKSSRFNSVVGRSNSINLWIETLFQRPLLRPGRNSVDFELVRDDGSVERSGKFNVMVSRLPDRVCAPGTLQSPSLDDCQTGVSICDRYFAMNNWCQDDLQ